MNEADRQSGHSPVSGFLITAAAFVIVVAGMKLASSILVLFLLSLFIAIICSPPLFWLQRKGVPRGLAVIIVVAVVLAFGVILGTVIGSSLNDFTRDWPEYQERLREKTSSLLDRLEGTGMELSHHQMLEAFDPGSAMKFVTGMLTGLGGVLANGFLILFMVVFMLLEASSFPEKFRALAGKSRLSLDFFETTAQKIKTYMALKTVISLSTGIIVALWLVLLRVDYPLLWGLLAFLFNFVPNIGSIIAAVPAVLMALLQLGPGTAALVAIGYIVVNVVMGNVIEPRVMGRGLGLSTLVVFLSLVFWGWVLGPVGMLLSAPLTMIVKIALDSYEETRSIGILLGSESSIRHTLATKTDNTGK